MKKTNKNKIEEFIRVDHAGERGAIKIYEGQLLALNTIVKNNELTKHPENSLNISFSIPRWYPERRILEKKTNNKAYNQIKFLE